MNPTFNFEEAKRIACKASILIEGLSGRGKSGLALLIAKGLTKDWTKVFAIDTENKSLNLFTGLPASSGEKFEHFNIGQLTKDVGYKPSNYLAFRESAIRAGAEAVIEDSISHAWQYEGGVLDIVTKKQSNMKNQYAAWGDSEVVKEKNELLALIRDDRVHVISTVRVKEKHEIVDGKPVSIGEQQIQQADLKYEPDLVLHMIRPGKKTSTMLEHPVAKVIKSRYAIFEVDQEYEFTPELIEQLRLYLEEGEDPAIILEKQREEYVTAVKAYLDEHKNAEPVWKVLKDDAGYKDTKLEDMPLDVVKSLYINLTN
jgi:hypothetical protein